MGTRKAGILCLLIGAIMVVSAALLFVNNKIDDQKAGEASKNVLMTIRKSVPEESFFQPESEDDALKLPTGTFATERLSVEMTKKIIDGNDYIGFLTIPAIDIELPVMSEWDYERLRIAPCRQFGSIKTDDLVIAAHNYKEHFGKIQDLEYGDLLLFTDMDGQTEAYAVTAIEILQPTQVDEMKNGDWDLTLYTCTYGGSSRVTVRFSRIDPELAERILCDYSDE